MRVLYHVTIFLSGELSKIFRYISSKSHSTNKDQNHTSLGTCAVASIPHTKYNRNSLSSSGAPDAAPQIDMTSPLQSFDVRTLEKTEMSDSEN